MFSTRRIFEDTTQYCLPLITATVLNYDSVPDTEVSFRHIISFNLWSNYLV